MEKPKIVLASILKPVDDTRMFEKFGISLSQTNKYDINIIGFYSKNLPLHTNLTFHPLFRFKRLNLKRLLAPWKAFRLFVKLKPQLLIVNTHELLIVSSLYKILFGTRLFYDVQENYYRNILYTKAFPAILRPLLASYVRLKEYASTLFVDHYLLAEKHYEKEFSFSRNKSTIIENKFKPLTIDSRVSKDSEKISLVFTGTLAESTGVFRAVELARKLQQSESKIELKIIGHCSQKNTLSKLKKIVGDHDFIKLKGGEDLVAHEEIIAAITMADFGIISYPPNYSTRNSTPTKLYEYLACELPILLQNHKPWAELSSQYNGGIIVNFDTPDVKSLLRKMKNNTFYNKGEKRQLLWESEEEKLLHLICLYLS